MASRQTESSSAVLSPACTAATPAHSRGQHDVVELLLPRSRRAGDERACHVAVIAVVQRTDVDDDRVAVLDDRVGRTIGAVGQR